MLRNEVERILARRPFVPLTIRLVGGRTLDVPFSHVAVPWNRYLFVFHGVKKEGSHVATGKTEVPFDEIASVEPRASIKRRRRTNVADRKNLRKPRH